LNKEVQEFRSSGVQEFRSFSPLLAAPCPPASCKEGVVKPDLVSVATVRVELES
jgi:hypothetical protein